MILWRGDTLLFRVGAGLAERCGAKDCGPCGGVDVLEERRRTMLRRVVVFLLGPFKLVEFVVLAGEECPEDANQSEQEYDAGSDRNGDQDDDARCQELSLIETE